MAAITLKAVRGGGAAQPIEVVLTTPEGEYALTFRDRAHLIEELQKPAETGISIDTYLRLIARQMRAGAGARTADPNLTNASQWVGYTFTVTLGSAT